MVERAQRRIARHLRESGLPEGKTFATFDFAAVPTVRKAHLLALAEADSWIEQGANILCFGPSGTGKSHAAAAIGYALIEQGRRVLFTRTTDIVQRLQAARPSFCPPPFVEIRVGNLGSSMGRTATCCLTCNQFKALTAHNGGGSGIRTHDTFR